MTIGELLVKLGIDTKAYEQGLAQVKRETQSTATKLGDIFKGAFSVALGVGFFEAVRRGFQAVVGEAVNFNAMMEQAQISFTTMLGSAEKAQAFLDEMAEFAAKTPFEYPDLVMAAKRMMAYGFAAEEVLPTLKAVGDAAAATGTGSEGINRILLALGQMRAKGKVSAEEMRQLTEANIKAWDILAEGMGKTTGEVMKLAERGLIPANKAVQILLEGMEKRFPNMMEKLQNSWFGVTSTIRDVWRITIGALTSNLFKGLVKWLQGVRDWATGFYNTFRRFGMSAALTKAFGADFAAAISIASAVLKGFWNTVKTVAVTIIKYWSLIKPAVLGAVVAFLSFKTVTWVLALAQKAVASFTFVTAVMRGEAVATSGILNVVARAVQIYRLQLHLASMAGIQHIGILQSLRIALYSVWSAMGPLGWAILGVSAAVTGGIMLWSKYAASVERANLESVLSKVNQQNKALTDSSNQVAAGAENQAGAMDKAGKATEKAGKAAGKNIQSFDEVHQLMEDTAGVAEDITAGLDEMAIPELEAPGALGVSELNLEKMLEQAKPTLSGFWDWIKQGFVNAWDWIKKKTGLKWWEILAALTGPIGAIGVLIYKNWDKIKAITEAVWESIGNVLSTTWQAIVNITTQSWSVIWDTLTQVWENLMQTARQVFGSIWDFIKGTWDNLYLTASTIWNTIWQTLSTIWSNIYMTASMIWQTIYDLIRGKIDLRTAATQIWTAIRNFFSLTWESIKNAATQIWSAITQFLVNEWQLAQQTASEIWLAIANFMSETWENIKQATEEIWNIISTNLGNVWASIRDAAANTWAAIKNHIEGPMEAAKSTLQGIWDDIFGFLERTWEGIKRTAENIWNGIARTIKTIINSIIKAFNWMIKQLNKIRFTIPGWVPPPLGGKSWGFHLPTLALLPLAEGGIVTQPTAALIGERGPEAVIPLTRSGFVDEMASAVASAVYTAIRDAFRVVYAEQGATQREIVLEIDGKRIARAIIPSLISEGQRTGTFVTVRGG